MRSTSVILRVIKIIECLIIRFVRFLVRYAAMLIKRKFAKGQRMSYRENMLWNGLLY